MSNLREAAQQALEAIDYLDSHPEGGIDEAETAIEALRAALAQPEPVKHKLVSWGFCRKCGHDKIPGESCARDNCPEKPEPAAPTEPAPGWCKHCRQYTIDEPLQAAPTVVEPVAWMWRNTKTGARGVYFEDPEQFFDSSAKGDYEWSPLFTHPPRTALTVDEAIRALVSALAESKGWLRDYSDGVIRDAIDRREARTALTDECLSLLDAAMDSSKYHEEQTRPIHLTQVTIQAIQEFLAENRPAASEGGAT